MKNSLFNRTLLAATITLFAACNTTENPVQSSADQAGDISGGKQTIAAVPTVTTSSANNITPFTARVEGTYTSNLNVRQKGICYSTSPNPTKASGYVYATSESSTGWFAGNIPGLKPNTLYYARAFAKNSDGFGYGNQVWTVENLRTTHYRNGDEIPNVTGAAAWSALSTGAFCNYNNDAANVAVYGRLYNWYAVADSRNIAPAGWHVATYEEWSTLVEYLGGSDLGGAAAKETGLAHWLTPNTGATNTGKFNAVPGGGRYSNGSSNAYFSNITRNSPWWTATATSATDALYMVTDYGSTRISAFYGSGAASYQNRHTGYAVRLIKD